MSATFYPAFNMAIPHYHFILVLLAKPHMWMFSVLAINTFPPDSCCWQFLKRSACVRVTGVEKFVFCRSAGGVFLTCRRIVHVFQLVLSRYWNF